MGAIVDPLIQTAEDAQRRAADPAASAWVGANAGTGKTKVLTDRVLNLLLTGAAPEKILCLTFTKAAAAEMANRLAKVLSQWAVAEEDTLDAALTKLRGEAPTPALRETARQLFARVLDVPGGMKIETIHAFCQALLRRFPLEAGVSPHFEVLDDRDTAELLLDAREGVLRDARSAADPALAEALKTVTGYVHETLFPELLAELTAARGRLRRLLDRRGGRDAVAQAVRLRLGVGPGDTAASVLEHACTDGAFDGAGLKRLCQALGSGGKSDCDTAAKILRWLGDGPTARGTGWDDYCSAFLTQKGEARSQAKFPTKAVKEAFPDCLALIDAETTRVLAVREHVKAAVVAEATDALLRLAEALLSAYEAGKSRVGKLDFDDLILAARRLLAEKEDAAWVLYKLDGGLSHVLIDEAQDTNPDQWAVVVSLITDFFAGETARDGSRTVFAVGDRKQSIYSFQGANPAIFESLRGRFRDSVQAVGRRWADVALEVSFRSTRPVLDLVDAVFEPAAVADGVSPAGEAVRHLAFRTGQAGSVELWPPLAPTEIEEPDAWKPPIERIRGEAAPTRLARLIARRVAAMLQAGERLESRGRPIRPGDVLVLVRRRGPFVEDLVRALKENGVPVAGIDRMVLTEQMAVMDLVALGHALLLPEDDLTLAAVLKGPLVGLSEDELFTVAHGRPRGVSLWRALREKAAEPGPWRAAHRALRELMNRADFLPPHELFADILGRLGGREKLLARLGPDAADPIDEFMALTLAYDRGHPPSLQAFLHWLAAGAQEIKRDLEEGTDVVRVMTVHGSKGLQAPVVFLPDTRGVPAKLPRLLWEGGDDDALFAWAPRSEHREAWCTELTEAAKTAQMQEYRRLLYVALTRAEDRLIVCGWDGQRAAPEDCWYSLVAAAMNRLGTEVADPFLAADGTLGDGTIVRLACPQTAPPRPDAGHRAAAATGGDLPAWARQHAPAEPTPPRPLAPSRPLLAEPPVRSPLAEDGGAVARFQRGRLVHRLLESLPDLPAGARESAALTYLHRPVWGLDDATAGQLAAETLAVLADPAFADLFAPGSRAEVPLTGIVGGHVVSGQVDRMVVTADAVRVIDFKTNRPPPRRVEDVAEAYLMQMATYRAVLSQLYPDRPVRCALLWTDGPFLMELPAAALDAALAALLQGPKA
ncbi:double-strand break repair helicase AddA [Novispirillum sp. DQ9]|uniref:double-strand break repair helicase AddA n=1 Tax=Novispirillum sp. DQ9 TaxID=3398612 RepID=UPI003C7BBD9D